MANVNTDIVTNFVATPQVKNDSQQLHGVKRIAQGTIALASGDLSATDTVMLAPIPTNASITSIKLFNDDLDLEQQILAMLDYTQQLLLRWMMTLTLLRLQTLEVL